MRLVAFITNKGNIQYIFGDESHRDLIERLENLMDEYGEDERLIYTKRYCGFIQTIFGNTDKTSHTIIYGESSDYPHIEKEDIDAHCEEYGEEDRDDFMLSEEVAVRLVEKLQKSSNYTITLFYEHNH